MSTSNRISQRVRKLLSVGLGLAMVWNVLVFAPGAAAAAVKPLPGPGYPIVFDDFSGGGVFNQPWMNWFNQDGGTGTFSKTTVDGREAGLFAQTPASASSWAKFQPWNVNVDLSGYRYVNYTIKNPGYPDELIKFVAGDGSHSFNLTGGWVSVPSDWTSYSFDLDALSLPIDKKNVIFEIWLRQSGGAYGELLVDGITATTASSGTAPTITGTSLSSNSGSVDNQNTMYTFAATYTDADNEAPFAMQLIIDDTPYDMDAVDPLDATYTDGKQYQYMTKLPVGAHTYYYRTTDTTSDQVATPAQTGPNVAYSDQVIDVAVSQAGYSANDYKDAQVVSTLPLASLDYEVLSGSTTVAAGTLNDRGVVWGKHVYSADFSAVTAIGADYRIRTNGISSFPFEIAANIWDKYKDEMTAFYRIQRASVATADAYPGGYSSVPPSPKVYHEAGHLDDAASEDRTAHYDLTGGWYDAGDYGKYGGNQWVGAEIALAYVRYAGEGAVAYDNDANGVPDLIDEAMFGSEYVMKFADQLGGAMYNLTNNASFRHPETTTDNISGTSDDRTLSGYGVGGSAKAAATLAATARAIRAAIAESDVDSAKVVELAAFAAECEEDAEVFYNYVLAHYSDPLGSYGTSNGGIDNSLLIADVELYLLTGDPDYKDAAEDKIAGLTFGNIASTNYWDMRPMALAEFYPVASAGLQPQIQSLLKQQLDYFISLQDDTPYGVLNQFKNFGVNEPHMSYVGDALRYYELFGDPAALRAVLKGMYWVYGENPWNISWVSGIGTDYVDFLHTRLDETANSASATGVVIPGAMVAGPNMKNTLDPASVSPWYEDRAVYADDQQQWRYNEFSISIQAGMLYAVMGLSATDSAASGPGSAPVELPILSPVIGDFVRGEVTIFADPTSSLSAIEYNSGSGYTAMTVTGDAYAGTVDESASSALANKRIDVRGTDAAGRMTYSSTHYTVASPLPDPSHPFLYDDFAGHGYWGATGGNSEWVNWYTQNGGSATFSRTTEGGRSVGKFTQTPASASSNAKFQPWHNRFDMSGYRYLNFPVNNPGYADLRMKIEMNDGARTFNLTGGWASVPTGTWTDFKIDLDSLPYRVNKDNLSLAIWLNQSTGSYGELFMDDITGLNDATGTAPTLTSDGVDHATGDTATDYTFSVTYTDADDEAPFRVELVLDGVVHEMAPVNAADTDYTNGSAYTYTTKLPQGIHAYYFHTTDTSSDAVSTSTHTGPTVIRPTTLLFSDDFSDGDTSGWTADSGSWTAAGGQLSGTGGPVQSLFIAGDSGWTDYTLEADVNITTNGHNDAGLVFRYVDADNFYVLFLKNNDNSSSRKMELVKYVNGSKTTLGYANTDIDPNTFYHYKIAAYGSSIEAYKDGVLEISATDATLSGGKIGARTYAHTVAYFDNFTVSP